MLRLTGPRRPAALCSRLFMLGTLGALGALTAAGTMASAGEAGGRAHSQWGERHSRNMVSDETGLPDSFDPATGRNIKWTARLGTATYATPVVSPSIDGRARAASGPFGKVARRGRGKVLIGTNNGRPRDPRHKGDRAVLMCFDEEDGEFLWQLVVPKLGERYSDWPNIGICSPPTIEGGRVYVVSNRAEVMCLDLDGQADGNDGPYLDEGRHMARAGEGAMEVLDGDADIIWLYDMAAELGVWQHDTAHCSVLVDGPYIYVNTANGVDDTHRVIRAPGAPSLIVLTKADGRLVAVDDARIGPNVFHSTWSSPALGEVMGRRLVFFCGGDGVCYTFEAVAHVSRVAVPREAAKLREVWRFDFDTDRPEGDPHQYQGNRREGPSNICGMPVFQEVHGGRIYVAGGGDVWHGKRKAWLKCVDATGTGNVTDAAEVWSYPLKRHCMSTPAVKDGLVYISDCGGQVSCLDAETGRPVWVHEAKREAWGSPLVADGKVYVGTRGRELWVLAAGRKKRVISHVKLDSPMSSTPVAANGVLYVTTMSRLYAVERAGK